MTSDGTSWPAAWAAGEIRALMDVRRDSYETLAEAVGACSETVRRWAAGEQRPAHKELLRALDATLAALEPWQRARFDQLATSAHAREGAGWASDESEETSETRRDEFLRILGGAGLAAFAPVDALDRIADDRTGRVDAGLLDSHERLARTLMAEFMTGDSRAVVPVALAHANDTIRLLDRHRPARSVDRRRLATLAVGVNARVGLWAFHAGDLGAARRHLSLAWGTAGASGDQALLGQAICMTSVLDSTHSGCCVGDPKRAVTLLDQALALVSNAQPHIRLWVGTWYADEVTAAGDAQASCAGLDAANRAREFQGDEPETTPIGPLVYGVESQLESARANAVALAGRFTDADRMLDAVLHSAVTVHHRVIVLCQIGRIRALAGQPDGSCEALASGLDLAQPTGYTTGMQRIRSVRAGFPSTWSYLPCVRELNERLR